MRPARPEPGFSGRLGSGIHCRCRPVEALPKCDFSLKGFLEKELIPPSFQPSFISETSHFPRIFGGFLERRIPGKNGNGSYLEFRVSYQGPFWNQSDLSNCSSPWRFLDSKLSKGTCRKCDPSDPISQPRTPSPTMVPLAFSMATPEHLGKNSFDVADGSVKPVSLQGPLPSFPQRS